MKRCPTHPGEMLREDFLRDYGLTASGFAKALGVSRRTVTELLRERRGVSPKMALCLSRLFGTSPEFWLNAQHNVDLWNAFKRNRKKISRIVPANPSGTCNGMRAEYDFNNGVRGKYAKRFDCDRVLANESDSLIIDREAERLNKNAREVSAFQGSMSRLEFSYKTKAMDEERFARGCDKLDPLEENAAAEGGRQVSTGAVKPRQGWPKRFQDAIRNKRDGKPARKGVL